MATERFRWDSRGAFPKWWHPGKALLGCFSDRTPSRGHVFQDIRGAILPQALPWAVGEEALSVAVAFFHGLKDT